MLVVFGRLLVVAALGGLVATPTMVVAVELLPLALVGLRSFGALGCIGEKIFHFFEATGDSFFHRWV